VGRGSYSHKYHEEETQGLSQSKENWQEPWPNPGDKADVVGKQKQHMFKAQLMWINLAYRIISFLVTLALSTINVGYHGMGVRCNSGFQTYTWHGAISDPPPTQCQPWIHQPWWPWLMKRRVEFQKRSDQTTVSTCYHGTIRIRSKLPYE
jgi:hypothetical protein